jgi:hypothetical protein
MGSLAEAVHRGTDVSVHYQFSTPTGSQLIITDPVLGSAVSLLMARAG